MEVAVLDGLGVAGVVGIGVDVSHVAGQGLALDGEGGGVKDVQGAVLELLGDFRDLLGSALGSDLLVDIGQHDGAGLEGAGPVGVERGAVLDGLDDHLIVRGPVDAGGNNEGVRAGGLGAAVVGHVRDAGLLAGGRSAHGVGVLADELAAAGDELVGSFLLEGLIVPGAGEGDVHGHARAHGFGAQIERGVAGDDFRIGEGTDIAHLGLIGGEFTGLDHFVELHTGSDAGEVAAFIDGGERIVVVAELLGVRLGAGGVAELHVLELLGGLDHEVLVAEAVGEDDVAAGVHKLGSGVVALLALGDIGLDDVLIIAQAGVLAGGLGGVDEVLVIRGVLIVQADEADLHGRLVLLVILGLVAAGAQCEHHDEREQHRNELFHSQLSL